MVRQATALLGLLSSTLIVGCVVARPLADSSLQPNVRTTEARSPSSAAPVAVRDTAVQQASYTQPAPSWRAAPQPPAESAAVSQQRLQIPSDLPGSEAPPIRLPAFQPGQTQPDRMTEIERLFRPLPELPAAMQSVEGAKPLSLAELQEMALRQSPVVHQAMADVQAARGAAIQAGAYPNPNVSYQEDNVNTGGTAGYQGVGISQTIPTGGKWRGAKGGERRGAERGARLEPHAQRSHDPGPLELLRGGCGQGAHEGEPSLVGIRRTSVSSADRAHEDRPGRPL